ncbi:hypothetical protein HY439_03360 [Candidatus Microgenomates bacterium]|nr:hypothetical protein [Candidatus Microgenomates bacterium]
MEKDLDRLRRSEYSGELHLADGTLWIGDESSGWPADAKLEIVSFSQALSARVSSDVGEGMVDA